MSSSVRCCRLPLWAHLTFAAIGFAAGLLGGALFIIKFVNLHAGVWSLISCVPSALVFHLHWLHRSQRIGAVHTVTSINLLITGGLAKIVISVLAVIVYVSLSIEYNIKMMPIETSLYLGAIQAGMVAKWSIALVIYGRNYKSFAGDVYGVI
jgi:hypothetical protein